MDSLLVSCRRRKSSASSVRDLTSSTNKVLAWLNNNLSSAVDTSCECCRSRRSSSFHVTSCLAVRGKILEDRLHRLNRRRRTIERRDDELEERRRFVEALAKRVLNSSGATLHSSNSRSRCKSDGDIPDPLRPMVTVVEEDVKTPVSKDQHRINQDVQVDQLGKLTPAHNSRTGLRTIKAAFRKMTSLVKPGTRTLTTQTSAGLLTLPPIGPPVELYTYYTKDGLKCTRC